MHCQVRRNRGDAKPPRKLHWAAQQANAGLYISQKEKARLHHDFKTLRIVELTEHKRSNCLPLYINMKKVNNRQEKKSSEAHQLALIAYYLLVITRQFGYISSQTTNEALQETLRGHSEMPYLHLVKTPGNEKYFQ